MENKHFVCYFYWFCAFIVKKKFISLYDDFATYSVKYNCFFIKPNWWCIKSYSIFIALQFVKNLN